MLCEVADVKDFLQKSDTDTSEDTIIAALCSAASTSITTHCEHEFEPPGDPEEEIAREFEYVGGGILSLAPYDIRSVSQIRIDVDQGDPTTLEAEEFRLPQPQPLGAAASIRLEPYLSHSRTRWAQRMVEVTGKWGLPSIPVDVKQAAIITVAIWLRRDVQTFTNVFNLEEAHIERPEALPRAVVGMLARYVRQTYV